MAGKLGQRKRIALGTDAARARMWNSMRQLRSFTTADIEATAEVGTSHARKYVKALHEVQYLALVTPKREGVAAGHAVYRLARNTGPVAPRFAKDGLFDANLADPYEQPENKRVTRHANALLKALREAVDAFKADYDAEGYDETLQSAMDAAEELIASIDGGAA